MSKWKVGTPVVPTKVYIVWIRSHLEEMYQVGGKFREDDLGEMLVWAMADVDLPRGKVVKGTPSEPETTVRVRFEGKFGTYEHYVEKDSILKKRRQK